MDNIIEQFREFLIHAEPHDISENADLEGMYYMAINDCIQKFDELFLC